MWVLADSEVMGFCFRIHTQAREMAGDSRARLLPPWVSRRSFLTAASHLRVAGAHARALPGMMVLVFGDREIVCNRNPSNF